MNEENEGHSSASPTSGENESRNLNNNSFGYQHCSSSSLFLLSSATSSALSSFTNVHHSSDASMMTTTAALNRRTPSVPDLQRYSLSLSNDDGPASDALANLGLTTCIAGQHQLASSNIMISPSRYMTLSLENKKIKPRIGSFSMEQALYFEPYQESVIKIELLQALRSSNLDLLRSFVVVAAPTIQVGNNSNTRQKEDKEIQDQLSSSSPLLLQAKEFQACNQFGENLLHLACRMGISHDVLEFLYNGANIPLNVRDRFGRTPLHNACMSSNPQFINIDFIVSKSPRMLLFEDDNGKLPFELIPERCFTRWIRFLSEQNILQRVVSTELYS